MTDLEQDPQYLIGRLTQALTQLLEEETPPVATEQLLSDAIKDAIDHRIGRAALCCHDGCARCEPDCDMDEAQRAELRITEGLAALALPETYLAARQRAGRRLGRRLGRRPTVRARARRAGGRHGDAGAG